MKIIGKTNEGLLLSATAHEVANLLGAYSSYQMEEIGLSKDDLKPGLEIDVKGAWEKLYWLERYQADLNRLRSACESVLKGIAPAEKLFKETIVQDKQEKA